MIERLDFDTAWQRSAPQLYAICLRSTGDRSQTDEILQRVAIRAWRAFPTFRWDCPVVSWLIKILYGEIAREIARRQRDRARETTLDAVPPHLAARPDLESDAAAEPDLRKAISDAVRTGFLSEQEERVVTARLCYPDESWPVLGDRLGMAGTTCASLHCRAVPKLRTYLFQACPELLGGKATIRRAFDTACKTEGRLSTAEIAAFRRVILEGAPAFAVGARGALRSACATVVNFLDGPRVNRHE